MARRLRDDAHWSAVFFAERPLQSLESMIQCEGTTSMQAATGRPRIRHRGSEARAGRGVCAVGAWTSISRSRVSTSIRRRRRRRLAARRDPAHAVLRTAVPQRRHRLRPGADGVCRHRDGDRQPRRQPRLSADDDGRPDHAFHARGHRLRRAGGRARGPARPHHELRPRHAVQRHRQQAGGDGLERVRDAARSTRDVTCREPFRRR